MAPLAALALAIGACSSDGDAQADDDIQPIESDADDPEPTDELEPEPEPEPEPDPEPEPAPEAEPEPEPEPEIDISVVPDEITEQYVEAVLNHLEELYSDALRIYAEEGELTLETTARLGSAFTEPQYAARLEEFQEFETEGFPDVRTGDAYGPRQHEVVEVFAARPGCIFVETILDITGLFEDSTPEQTAFVVLGPIDVERPDDRSQTPWRIYRLPSADNEDVREATPCE